MPRHEKQSVCKGSAAVPGGLPTRPCSRSILPKQGLLSPRSPRASSPNCSCENNAHSRGLEKIRQTESAREGLCFPLPSASTPTLSSKHGTSSVCWEASGAGGDFEVTEDLPSILTTSNLCMCSQFTRRGFLGAGTLEFYVGGDLGVQGNERGEGVEETVCEPAVAQRLRPGHQGPVSSSNTLISLQL